MSSATVHTVIILPEAHKRVLEKLHPFIQHFINKLGIEKETICGIKTETVSWWIGEMETFGFLEYDSFLADQYEKSIKDDSHYLCNVHFLYRALREYEDAIKIEGGIELCHTCTSVIN